MAKRLTELSISKLKAPTSGAKYAWHPDELLPSFGVRIYSTGRRVFGVTRRWNGAKHPAFRKIADHAGLSLSDARAQARLLLADPLATLPVEPDRAEPDAPQSTFRALADEFLSHGRTKRGRELRPATVKEYRRCLIVYAAGLADRDVTEVRRADAAAMLRAVAAAHSTTMAMHARAAGSRFYSWLLANGYVEHNPFTGTEGYTVPKRKRVLTDAELRAIWQATEGAGDFNAIVRLCLWFGARRSEPGGMARAEIEQTKTRRFEGLVWKIPGTRTKNHRDLWLPVPRQARNAIEALPVIEGRRLLFGLALYRQGEAEPRERGFQGWSQAKARLDARIARINAELRLGRKLREKEQPAKRDAMPGWDLHDLRRTVETRLADLEVRKEITNRILNHAQGPITEAYDQHDYLAEKLQALQGWANELERITGRDQGNVVPISTRRAG